MSDRASIFARAQSIVVKLGTQVLSDANNRLDLHYLTDIARQVKSLRDRNVKVTIVSSGATGAGLAEMNLSARPKDLATLQAIAAIGQRKLMDGWAAAFFPHELHVGQILLTREDIDDRSRFLNLRNTIHALHELNSIPIINENDTISTDELVRISFGDNDILAALVTQAIRADALILLSVVDGVLDSNGSRVPMFQSIDDAVAHLQPTKSALGRGGMNSKLEAARLVTQAGESLVIAHGRVPDVLTKIVQGADLGTMFVSRGSRRTGRSRWISSARPSGKIIVDAGAAEAISQRNRSLLPAGVVEVSGEFEPGDVVEIVDDVGTIIARGLTNYSSFDTLKIKGMKSDAVRKTFPQVTYDEVVHRDNLIVVRADD